MIKKYLLDEEGMGTVELVLIIAALVSIAIIFRKYIIEFVQKSLGTIFGNEGAGQAVPIDTETKPAQ